MASPGVVEEVLVDDDRDLSHDDGTCVLCGGGHIGRVDGDLGTMLFAVTKWNRTVAPYVGLAPQVAPLFCAQ